MKILQTGSLGPHWGRDTSVKVSTLSQIMKNTLTEMGHTVHSGPPTSDIDVTEYDLVLSEYCSCAIMFARYQTAHLLLQHVAAYNKVPHVAIIGHNPHAALFSSYTRYSKPDGRKFGLEMQNPAERQWIEANWRAVVDMGERLSVSFPDTMINCFPWGDHELIWEKCPRPNRVFYVDPTSMAKTWTTHDVPYTEKDKSWLLAAGTTSQTWHTKLQPPLQWPVKIYGKRGREDQKRVTEDVIVEETERRWGNLCPPWPNLEGSGYWRVRYIHSANCRSILVQSAKDAGPMDNSYGLTPRMVESCSDSDRVYLAERQRESFYQCVESKEQFVGRVEKVLKEARPYGG
jgi:hypothetical protein